MRLSTIQQHSIRESVERFLAAAKILLYGSRADDTKRGGDIDLLILTKDTFERSIQYKILAAMYLRLGEQKIDLLIENPDKLSNYALLVIDSALPL
jgi:predicted nucleotidyltransferase